MLPQCPLKIELAVILAWRFKKNRQTTKLKSLLNAPLIRYLIIVMKNLIIGIMYPKIVTCNNLMVNSQIYRIA